MTSVYDGQICVGTIEPSSAGIIARDITGKRIGTYPTSLEAMSCCLRHARQPPPSLPDAEEELAEEVEAFMRAKS